MTKILSKNVPPELEHFSRYILKTGGYGGKRVKNWPALIRLTQFWVVLLQNKKGALKLIRVEGGCKFGPKFGSF